MPKKLLSTFLILSLLTPSLSLAQESDLNSGKNIIPIYFFLTTDNPPHIVALTPITDDIFAYATTSLEGMDYQTAEQAVRYFLTTTPLTYDNNGNQTGNGSSTYAFDYRNRMTDSTVNSAASSYSYDSNNER
ncbi:MAG: hypothetical protein Q7K40_01265, partial [bacterium]|nr:hypothetical protein [bacterium]